MLPAAVGERSHSLWVHQEVACSRLPEVVHEPHNQPASEDAHVQAGMGESEGARVQAGMGKGVGARVQAGMGARWHEGGGAQRGRVRGGEYVGRRRLLDLRVAYLGGIGIGRRLELCGPDAATGKQKHRRQGRGKNGCAGKGHLHV